MRDPDGSPAQAHRKIAKLQIFFEQYEKQQKPARYVMLILDKLPDGTCRALYWSRYGSATGVLTERLDRASVFDTPEHAQQAFDNDGGDSFLQGENGDSLTYDKTLCDGAGDYTYERYIIKIK